MEEILKEFFKKLQEANAYINASIEGKGVHIGRIKGLSFDADGNPIIDIDIDALSCTSENYFDAMMSHLTGIAKSADLVAKDWCIEHGYAYSSHDDKGVFYRKAEGEDLYHSYSEDELKTVEVFTNEN